MRKIFYFQPGHETYPNYNNEQIMNVITNAVRWAKFEGTRDIVGINNAPNLPFSLETMWSLNKKD